MDKEFLILEDNVRHTFMSIVWSHKIQEKQADILSEKYTQFEIIRIICSSLTSVGLISLILTDQFWVKLLSALLSFVSTAISMFFKSFDMQKNVSNHKKAAIELLIFRDKFRLLLIEVRLETQDAKVLLAKYEELQNLLAQVYKDAPNTSDKAVKRASEALNIKKDNEFSDVEIDGNLPESLQRS